MQPNPQSLVNMATNCDRNLSVEQVNELALARVWPNAGTEFGSMDTVPNAPIAHLNSIQRKQLDEAVAKATIVPKTELKTEAVKFDSGKVDWTLVPFEALEDMVKVLEFGAKKYDRWNWTNGGGFQWTRVAASGMRHLFAWLRGEDNDPESGLSHIAHAQCNLLFIAYYIRNKNKMNKDDRNVR